MATSDNGSLPTKGHVGEETFYLRQGQVIMRQRHNKRSKKGRTPKSMAVRTTVSNLVSLWRSYMGGLHDCFEHAKQGSTDYSGFMSVNRRISKVYLTKEQAMEGYTLADNIAVSQGSLQPNIQVTPAEGLWMSDIYISPNAENPDEPLGNVWMGIGSLDSDTLQDGDEIVFVRSTQTTDNPTHMPQVLSVVSRLVFDKRSRHPWQQMISGPRGADGFLIHQGRLCAEQREDSLVAWVHLRRVSSERVLATSQNLVGTNTLLPHYTSEQALQQAIHSYGPLDK